MSYKYLTGRLIETQRSMIGEPAIRIARSIEGIDVTGDGAVRSIEGEGYTVVAELSRRYTDILGNAAERRLVAAASEFKADLVLPPALGGPDDPDEVDSLRRRERAPSAEAADDDPSVGVASDGGTVAVHSGDQLESDHPSPSIATTPGESASSTGESTTTRSDSESTTEYHDAEGRESDTETDAPDHSKDEPDSAERLAEDDADVPVPETLVVDYTVASPLSEIDDGEADLASLYLLPTGDDEWHEPITVEAAVVDAVSAATHLSTDDIETPIESIEMEPLLATLDDEREETVSFGVEGVTVTFHRSGSLAVH